MKTRKEIATISYNSEEFLKEKLDELLRNHVISDYIYIKHEKEVDEKKSHIHLWVKPNKTLDTMDLQEHFMELDLQHPDKKPLGVIDFRASKIDDWILYSQHYEPYLASKAESREYHYSKDDFRYADEYSFEDYYYHAFKGSEWAKRYAILQQLCDGRIAKADLIKNGTVPLQLAPALRSFEYLETHKGTLDRGSHSNHEEETEWKNKTHNEFKSEEIDRDELIIKKMERSIEQMQLEVNRRKELLQEDKKKIVS